MDDLIDDFHALTEENIRLKKEIAELHIQNKRAFRLYDFARDRYKLLSKETEELKHGGE